MKTYLARQEIVQQYKTYLHSFLHIHDDRLKAAVEKAFQENALIPESLIQLKPFYKRSESLEDLIQCGRIQPDFRGIFGTLQTHES